MFPHICISGNPEARGVSYGRQARHLIELAIEAYRRSFFERGYSWQEVMRVGRKFSESIAEFDSTMLEELRGIAEGAQRDLG
ncbi:MAG: acyl-CoA--6-aminopenicillanic acid acyltransferase, partial [Pseudomonadota bacterium]